MNNNQTIEKLKQMRLTAMAQLHGQYVESHQYSECSADEYLALLTDHEWENRYNRKIQRLIQQANFRQKASVEEVSYKDGRHLDKNMFQRLATLGFIAKKENLIITGSSGVGKSYLAQALGYQACFQEHKVLYSTTARLLNRLKLSKLDGTYLKEIQKLNKVQLLILDDFGLQAFDKLRVKPLWILSMNALPIPLLLSHHNYPYLLGMKLLERVLLLMPFWTVSLTLHIEYNSKANP